MEQQKISLLFNKKLDFEKLNDSFLRTKCYVMALGKNQNMTYFSKENVDKAFSSLSLIPVIGHLMENGDGRYYLGGHDVTLDTSDYTLKSLCVPFGVVMPSDYPQYETVTEDDGTTATYLVADCVIWVGRYPEIKDAIYNNNIYFSESMEILYRNSEPLSEDNSYRNITDFSFDALCLLNKSDDPKFNVEPCFPSSSFVPANFSAEEKDIFTKLMKEMKNELKFCLSKSDSKGGKDILENQDVENLNEPEKDSNTENFNHDDAEVAVDTANADTAEKAENTIAYRADKFAKNSKFSVTFRELEGLLYEKFPEERTVDAYGEPTHIKYTDIMDFDDKYVYVFVYQFDAGTENSETVETCLNGRYAYTYNENDGSVAITGVFEPMVCQWVTADEKKAVDDMRDEFAAYKENHTHEDSEYEKLVEFEKSVKDKEHNDELNNVISKYSVRLSKDDIFMEYAKSVQEGSCELSAKELADKCIYLIGLDFEKKELNFSADKKNSNVKFPIDEEPHDDEPYGGVFKQYGIGE